MEEDFSINNQIIFSLVNKIIVKLVSWAYEHLQMKKNLLILWQMSDQAPEAAAKGKHSFPSSLQKDYLPKRATSWIKFLNGLGCSDQGGSRNGALKREARSKQNSSRVLCAPRHPTTHTHTHAQELARKEQSRKSCGDKRSRPQLLMSASLFHTCETFCQDAESFKSMTINRHPLPGKHSLTSHQQGNF